MHRRELDSSMKPMLMEPWQDAQGIEVNPEQEAGDAGERFRNWRRWAARRLKR